MWYSWPRMASRVLLCGQARISRKDRLVRPRATVADHDRDVLYAASFGSHIETTPSVFSFGLLSGEIFEAAFETIGIEPRKALCENPVASI